MRARRCCTHAPEGTVCRFARGGCGCSWGRGEGRRPNGGCCPARPAPDIRAVKRSPRSTRACDPRAPPRWHGCLQVSACNGKKKKSCFVKFCGKYSHRLPRVSGGARTLHERSPAAGVLSRAPQGACTTLLPCDRFHQLPEFGCWAAWVTDACLCTTDAFDMCVQTVRGKRRETSRRGRHVRRKLPQ